MILNLVKILLGRQLTQEQIETATKNQLTEDVNIPPFVKEQFSGNHIYKIGNEIKKVSANYDVININYGIRIPFLLDRTEVTDQARCLASTEKRTYDEKGRLTQEEIRRGTASTMWVSEKLWCESIKITAYNPPGSLFGKTAAEWISTSEKN